LAVKARIPWLFVTLLGQLVVASIIGVFTHTVASEVKAFSFLPLLCGVSGNMGVQSDTIAVRGIALDAVRWETYPTLLKREIKVAFIMGGIFALVLGGASFVMYRHLNLSLLLALFVLIAMVVSAVLGMSVSVWIKYKFKHDPAGIGGPFITAFMDLSLYTLYLLTLTTLAAYLI
jgi:magnesium transporter